ncbi:MAG TPA: phosphatase PAP2 family protein [Dehalococcoidia bacterium]|nr:phosphatase PAP2 family protein [Dehalococcoidia bacterium]
MLSSTVSRRRLLQAGAGTGAALTGALLLPRRPREARAQASGPIEPNAGRWLPWLLSSGDQFRPPAPPDTAATAAEVAQLKAMAAQRDGAANDRIAFWEGGTAPHPWNQVFIRYANVTNFLPGQLQARALTFLNVAMYDAMIATWDAKYAYNRPRPTSVDPTLTAAVPVPNSPSYPSEHAAAAGAASTLLAHLYPNDAQMFMDMADEAANSRVLAGVQFPSDVAAGLALGRQVGMLAIQRSDVDDLNATWNGEVPVGPGLWVGTNPPGVVEQNWKTLVIPSKDALRPPPPPAWDSDERARLIDEVKTFPRTPRTNGVAFSVQYGLYGQPDLHFLPILEINDRVQQYHLEHNAPWVARAYAAIGAGWLDAYIASQDAKFFYWEARPDMFDSSIKTLFPDPPFPGYISNGAVLSGVTGALLAHFFPRDAEVFQVEADQAAESRLWAGIHFRNDIDTGKAMGRTIAGMVIDRMKNDA